MTEHGTAADVGTAVPWAAAAALGERMTAAAAAFAETLDASQRLHALRPFSGAAHRDWHYVPRARPGLPLRAMAEAQRKAAWTLVDAALSAEGAAKARGVLALEAILRERTANKAYRDPENYALALFGEPGRGPWAWRFEGHHLSLTLTVVPSVGIALTPHFLGANPLSGRVVEDNHAHGGLARVLDQESALAFEVVNGLDAPALRQAVIATRSPADFFTGPGRELAEAVMAKVREAGIGSIRFAWAGATTPEDLHYYRLHGPTLIVEYDKTDHDHAHSVWHDPTNLFGEDHLRAHRLRAHGG